MRNVDDRDVEKFLLQLTFLPTAECRKLGSATDAKEINKAKEILAYEVVKLVHGKEEAVAALDAARALLLVRVMKMLCQLQKSLKQTYLSVYFNL